MIIPQKDNLSIIS